MGGRKGRAGGARDEWERKERRLAVLQGTSENRKEGGRTEKRLGGATIPRGLVAVGPSE